MEIPSHRQVIAGITFDTTTAEPIGWIYDDNIIDSHYEGTTPYLMRQNDGRFFLFSIFGTMTTRAIRQIVPLTTSDVARWCEANGFGSEKIARLSQNTGIDFEEMDA